jgi:hypothetical protein
MLIDGVYNHTGKHFSYDGITSGLHSVEVGVGMELTTQVPLTVEDSGSVRVRSGAVFQHL